MAFKSISCTKCDSAIPLSQEATQWKLSCQKCNSSLDVYSLPAFYRKQVSSGVAINSADGSSSCFFHPEKQAEWICEKCGRFFCELCHIELLGRKLCPPCMASTAKRDEGVKINTRCTLHDQITLSIAILPLFFWPLTVISSGAVFYYGIKHWNSPGGIRGASRTRLWIAFLIAFLQIGFWISLLFGFLLGVTKPHE